MVAQNPARSWIETALREEKFEVCTATDGYHGILELFKPDRPNLVISDLTLRERDALDLLQTVKDADREIPVIMLTAGEELWPIIEAMERGAYGCIEKPVEICKLQQMIAEALDIRDLPGGNGTDKPKLAEECELGRVIVGDSHEMFDIRNKIRLISSRRSSALVEGESGAGKRLVSRAIHDSGVTRGHPFVAVDLPALPEPLLEKVLFGEVKRTHFGQSKDSRGLFEIAGAGTILLNGVSEISPDVQEKLLRVLERKVFEPVGGNTAIPVRARVLGTSGKNLRELVRSGQFSEHLFYRIAHCLINIPPLRERRKDIPRLVIHLLRKTNKELHKNVKRIPPETLEILQNHAWPGNVRELENVLARAIAAAEGDELQKKYLTFHDNGKQGFPADPQKLSLDSAEKDHIKHVLDQTNWDKRKAARLLNISRQTLYNKIRTYKIVPE